MERNRYLDICIHLAKLCVLLAALHLKILAYVTKNWGKGEFDGDKQDGSNVYYGLWESCYCAQGLCQCHPHNFKNLPGWFIAVQAIETLGLLLLVATGVLMFILFFRKRKKIFTAITILLLIKIPLSLCGTIVFSVYVTLRGADWYISIGSTIACAVLLGVIGILQFACHITIGSKLNSDKQKLHRNAESKQDIYVIETKRNTYAGEKNTETSKHGTKKLCEYNYTTHKKGTENVFDDKDDWREYGFRDIAREDKGFGRTSDSKRRNSGRRRDTNRMYSDSRKDVAGHEYDPRSYDGRLSRDNLTRVSDAESHYTAESSRVNRTGRNRNALSKRIRQNNTVRSNNTGRNSGVRNGYGGREHSATTNGQEHENIAMMGCLSATKYNEPAGNKFDPIDFDMPISYGSVATRPFELNQNVNYQASYSEV